MHKIAVIPGDGTGPEVVREGLKVLAAVSRIEGFDCETVEYDFGGDRYLATGEVLPEAALDELRSFDAIYLGAVGHPDVAPGILEKAPASWRRACCCGSASSFSSTSTSAPSSSTPASRRR